MVKKSEWLVCVREKRTGRERRKGFRSGEK